MDSYTNHYAWILETSVDKWLGSGWGLKYSIVDWHRFAPTLNYGDMEKAGTTLVINNPRYRFIVSQLLLTHEKKVDFGRCKTLLCYAGALKNHAAIREPQTDNRKLNKAWYVGFTLGKLRKACDWSLDVNYQNVQAQAVPEFDLLGIGHGNAVGGFLSDAIMMNLPIDQVRMFTNYKGWEASIVYALTDTFSVRARGQYAVPCDKGIGGNNFRYKAWDMAVIYAF